MADESAPGQQGPIKSLVDFLASVAGPLGLIGALLYYIGVVDAREYFSYFGVDYALLGFSTVEYVSRSADVIIPTSIVAVSAIMTLFFVHVLARQFPRLLRLGGAGRWVRRGLPVVAALTLLVGAVGFAATSGGSGWRLAFPISIMVSVLLIESIGTTADQLGDGATRKNGTSGLVPARRLTVAVTIILVGLVLISSNSGDRARARAAKDGTAMVTLPAVAVFSEKDLAITGSGVVALRQSVVGGQYNFRYTGLRVLGRGNYGVLLVPDGWRPGQGNTILLRQDSSIRFDFIAS